MLQREELFIRGQAEAIFPHMERIQLISAPRIFPERAESSFSRLKKHVDPTLYIKLRRIPVTLSKCF